MKERVLLVVHGAPWELAEEVRDKEEILKERRKLKQQTMARRRADNLAKEAEPVT